MAASLLIGAIAIVGIPHGIAVERNHPHQEAIYFAGWVSLFTLHAVWPLLWVWAAAYREDRSPKFVQINEDTAINDKASVKRVEDHEADADVTDSITLLRHRFDVLKDRIERIEKAIMAASKAA
jgi:hypothetical protein